MPDTSRDERALVERLRERDAAWQKNCDHWEYRIRELGHDLPEAWSITRNSLDAQAAAAITSLSEQVETLRKERSEWHRRAQKAEGALERAGRGYWLTSISKWRMRARSLERRLAEVRAETIEACQRAICSGCATDVPINAAGSHDHAGFTFPCHASAIRAHSDEARREDSDV